MCGKLLDPRLRKAAAQVQIRLIGQSRQEVEAALVVLQAMADVYAVRGPRRGRNGEWLIDRIVSLSQEGHPSKARSTQK